MTGCEKIACMDCSIGVLMALIEVMQDDGFPLKDVRAKDICAEELTNDCVYDWFRCCDMHDNVNDLPVMLRQHVAELNTLLGEHNTPANPWIMGVTVTRRPRTFPFIT